MNRGSCHEFPWFLGIKSRSLSVGDFIEIIQNVDAGDRILYQVASFGFNRVSVEHMETFMKEVKTSMDSGNHPFRALCDTVWKHGKIDA